MQGRAPTSLIRHLATTAHTLRERYTSELTAGCTTLHEARASLADTLHREVTPTEAADTLAQSTTCAAPLLASGTAPTWLLNQLSTWERFALSEAALLAPTLPLPHAPTPHSALRTPHLFEPFLHAYSATTRKRRGVFFTPEPIARFIVSQIDLLLRTDFHLPAGLASHSALHTPHSALPRLLDPACGTGIFLLATIDQIHDSLTKEWTTNGTEEPARHRRWNTFVENLLPRLIGIEILPPAALLSKLNLTQKLATTAYDFKSPTPLRIFTADALSPGLNSALRAPHSALPVILGNPPFSSLSTTTNRWIAQLVRGDENIRGYIQANGQKLNERKTWLHDDYVKFIRLAQWHIEQAGCGIVGFVTNHGYLDNTTFRLMRQELLRVFPHIQIIDLHGNRRARGIDLRPAIQALNASEGTLLEPAPDENLFHLDQGLAISLLSRPLPAGDANRLPRLDHLDLYGPRASKLAALADPSLPTTAIALTPAAPHYRFSPAPPAPTHPEYLAAWSLNGAMPVNTPAPVTARDHFVVAFTRDELEHRIAEFCDLSIPDEEIRQRYFTRTRSARYAPGDTRSWKLAAARRTVAADSAWQEKITRCLYRPFDWRYIFWHPAMIDWPRTGVTRHLLANEIAERGTQSAEQTDDFLHSALRTPHSALCLIARRQQLPTQPCTFFWIADGLALDGVIRSDNRGSESLFPLYKVVGTGAPAQRVGVPSPRSGAERPGALTIEHAPNFAPAFLSDLTARIGRAPAPLETLAYIYALFHSPTYRTRYAADLRTNFPHILIPRSSDLFAALAGFGQELIALHLLTPHSALRTPHSHSHSHSLSHPPTLPLSHSIAAFRAGGHPALQKWLQPPHRSAADPAYAQIASAIEETLRLMPAIDAAVARWGGWPAAFAQSSSIA